MAATDVGSKAWFQLLLWSFAVASIWHILSVNTQTRLSMHAVLPESSLLSHINKFGVYMASLIRQCSDKPKHACSLTALTHAQNGRTYGIFFQSMLRSALACVQSRQSLQFCCTCTQWAYTRHVRSVNAQTSHSVLQSCQSLYCTRTCTKWAYIWHIFFSQCSDET